MEFRFRLGTAWASGVRVALAAAFLLGVVACSASVPAEPRTSAPRGKQAFYAFGTLDGRRITNVDFAGRVTVLLFGTSYDLVTQAVAKRLGQLWHEHAPRSNVALILVEPPENVDMARAYQEVLGIDYPVGLADGDPAQVAGSLGHVEVVPSWLFLSPSGRISASAVGDLSLSELRRLVVEAERAP
jgi:hypothetical protein